MKLAPFGGGEGPSIPLDSFLGSSPRVQEGRQLGHRVDGVRVKLALTAEANLQYLARERLSLLELALNPQHHA